MPHHLFGTQSMGQFLRHLATEVLIFFVTEFLVRIFIPNTARKVDRIKLLVIQGSLLLAASLILHLFQYRPIFLMALALFIFVKLMFVSSAQGTSDEYGTHSKVSKLLPKSLSDETSSDTFQTKGPWGGSTWSWQAPGVLPHPAAQPTTPLITGGWQEPSWHNLSKNLARRPKVQSTLPYQASGTTAAVHKASAAVASQKDTSGGYQSSNYQPSHKPTLQRSPLLGSSVFQHTVPYFGYFSSLWDHKRRSECPPGIRNAGNTCFVNSTLQSLARTPGFLQALNMKKDTATSSSALLQSLHSLLDKCSVLPDASGGYVALDASEVLANVAERAPHLVVSPKSGQRQSQQDAAEFLLWLLDALHDDIPRTNTSACSQNHSDFLITKEECSLKLQLANSEDMSTIQGPLIELATVDWALQSKNGSSSIHDLFLGQIVEARECQNCKKLSVNVEYFTVLPLPIPDQPASAALALESCFHCFSTVEELDHSNMMTCSCIPLQEGNELILTPGKRIAMLSRLPKRLVIQLTRFSYSTKLKSVRKNIAHIAIPTTIDIAPHIMESKFHANLSKQKTVLYKLYAFCTHTGAQSTSFGHYMAYCLASNGVWYCFNDGHVSEVRDIENELLTNSILQNAYMLFYTCLEQK